VAKRHPKLAPLLKAVRWAVNFDFVDLSQVLEDGDEVGLLPPVAGGAQRTRVCEEPLDVSRMQRAVEGPGMGAAVLFIGTVRNNAQGKEVEHLHYEAYEPMAQQQLERIADELCQHHEGLEMAIEHRTGTLEVGEVAIIIAAASPHRDAAFTACREALERIKVDVPIWKKETSPGGDAWVGWGAG